MTDNMTDNTHNGTGSMSPNPYLPMLGSYRAANFVGRGEVMSSLVQAVTAPTMGTRVVRGIRTIGKTSVLHYLADRKGAFARYSAYVGDAFRGERQDSLLWVYVPFEGETVQDDAHRGGNQPVALGKMLRTLSTEIQHLATRSGDERLKALLPEDMDGDLKADLDVVQCYATLEEKLTRLARRGVRAVFLLDDLDEVLADASALEEGFARGLQTRAAFVVGMRELPANIRSSFLNTAVIYDLGLLNETDARKLLLDPLQPAGLSLTDEDIKLLFEVAGRQPCLLTAAAAVYLPFRDAELASSSATNGEDVRRRLIRVLIRQPNVSRVLVTLWDEVTSDPLMLPPRELLYNLACHPEQPPDLHDTADPNLILNLIRKLEDRGYLASDSSGMRVFGTLFAEYVRQRFQSWKQQIHPTSGDLKAAIRARLGPKDNKLFDHLVAKPGELYQHEELLEAIWGRTNLKERRPLDASMNRVRRVLSDLDSDWTYIENEHGVGFRWRPRPAASGESR